MRGEGRRLSCRFSLIHNRVFPILPLPTPLLLPLLALRLLLPPARCCQLRDLVLAKRVQHRREEYGRAGLNRVLRERERVEFEGGKWGISMK